MIIRPGSLAKLALPHASLALADTTKLAFADASLVMAA